MGSHVGGFVGAGVGLGVGGRVGDGDGARVGASVVGCIVGDGDGAGVGAGVGLGVGGRVGDREGARDGASVVGGRVLVRRSGGSSVIGSDGVGDGGPGLGGLLRRSLGILTGGKVLSGALGAQDGSPAQRPARSVPVACHAARGAQITSNHADDRNRIAGSSHVAPNGHAARRRGAKGSSGRGTRHRTWETADHCRAHVRRHARDQTWSVATTAELIEDGRGVVHGGERAVLSTTRHAAYSMVRGTRRATWYTASQPTRCNC